MVLMEETEDHQVVLEEVLEQVQELVSKVETVELVVEEK
jgi:hypothetical protein